MVRGSKRNTANSPLSCVLELTVECTGSPTVIMGKHVCADESVHLHEVEWYRERFQVFRLYSLRL